MSVQTSIDPIPFIRHWADETALAVRAGGVLDLACGGGRHGRLFLDGGWPVTFLDRDISGIQDLAGQTGATVIAADLESDGPWPLSGRQFDIVIVTNYLWRPVMGRILDLVAPGGLILYETFARGNEAFGRPSNPDFLLEEGELKRILPGDFEVLQYEQGLVGEPANALKQRLAARRNRDCYEVRRPDGYRVCDDPGLLDIGVMHEYLASSYWYRGLARSTMERITDHSLCFGLYDPSGTQVGFGRMVTDRTTFSYLADVFVLDELQGQGLGSFLMEAIMAHPDLQALKRHMLVTRDAHGLYEKFGFEAVEAEDAPKIMVLEDMEFHLKRRD